MIKTTSKDIEHNDWNITQETTTFAGWEGQALLVRLFIFLTKNMKMLGGLTEGLFSEDDKTKKVGLDTVKKMFAQKIDLEQMIGVFLNNFDQTELKKLISDLLAKTTIQFHTFEGEELSEVEFPQTFFTLSNKKDFDSAFAGELSLLVPVIKLVLEVNYKDFLALWASWAEKPNG